MKNFKKVFNLSLLSIHIYISFLASFIGIVAISIFYIHSVLNSQELLLAKFSLIFLIYFSLSLFCLIGNDQEIIATSKNIKSKFINIDSKIFRILVSYFIVLILFYLIKYFKNIFIIDISDDDLIIIHIALIFFIFNRIIQAFCQASSKLIENSTLDFARNVGYLVFVLLWLFEICKNISLIFVISELFVFILIFFYFLFFNKKIKYQNKSLKFNKQYITIGLSQFSYQSIFKADIFTLAIFGNPILVVWFSVLSNVVEGIVNFITTFHPVINNFIIKKNNRYKINKEKKNIKFIMTFCSVLILLITPAYIFFNILIFKELPNIIFLISIIIINLSIFFFRNLFFYFNLYSMIKQPNKQFLFSIGIIISNISLNMILFKFIGVLGIALASMLTMFIFYEIINKSLKNNKII
jgi:O-antigen/teichoic acid export membrane protein